MFWDRCTMANLFHFSNCFLAGPNLFADISIRRYQNTFSATFFKKIFEESLVKISRAKNILKILLPSFNSEDNTVKFHLSLITAGFILFKPVCIIKFNFLDSNKFHCFFKIRLLLYFYFQIVFIAPKRIYIVLQHLAFKKTKKDKNEL